MNHKKPNQIGTTYIILFKPSYLKPLLADSSVTNVKDFEIAKSNSLNKIKLHYEAQNINEIEPLIYGLAGYVAQLDDQQLNTLRQDSNVAKIVDDFFDSG
ncbi:MAG: protease inhibitor I9 family protein [Cytophagales bacterium]|nr:protease inhibitor I9 family protein [Cytophagales bacterium]